MAFATSTFRSGGQRIRLEITRAVQPGPRPAVLLLHGADGLARGDHYRLGAGLLAGAGYHTFLLHYLDRTGEVRAVYDNIKQNLPVWADTVRAGLERILAERDVEPERLGIVGTSLGAALAFMVAAVDQRVKAIVDCFGFMPEPVRMAAVRLPPTLVLHGALDAIVPVQNARAIVALLERLQTPHEVHIYPDQAHSFRGGAEIDALRRAAAFLQRHLQPVTPASTTCSGRGG